MAKRMEALEQRRNTRVITLDNKEYNQMILAYLQDKGLIPAGSTLGSMEYSQHFRGFIFVVDLPGGAGTPYNPDETREA